MQKGIRQRQTFPENCITIVIFEPGEADAALKYRSNFSAAALGLGRSGSASLTSQLVILSWSLTMQLSATDDVVARSFRGKAARASEVEGTLLKGPPQNWNSGLTSEFTRIGGASGSSCALKTIAATRNISVLLTYR